MKLDDYIKQLGPKVCGDQVMAIQKRLIEAKVKSPSECVDLIFNEPGMTDELKSTIMMLMYLSETGFIFELTNGITDSKKKDVALVKEKVTRDLEQFEQDLKKCDAERIYG